MFRANFDDATFLGVVGAIALTLLELTALLSALHAIAVITLISVVNKLVDMAIVRWDLAKRAVDGGTLEVVRGHIVEIVDAVD
ncbi:MAG TPA: hypothetical protein P5307_29765, partial [Pirellulaceae bacterium]|nr:hypothetical protein [Pirellulaceae bacterium]